jgi:hypothetical protein
MPLHCELFEVAELDRRMKFPTLQRMSRSYSLELPYFCALISRLLCDPGGRTGSSKLS